MKRLADKTAFVTAAGQGIGRAIAMAYAAEGARVIASDLNGALLDGLDVVQALTLDVTDSVAVQAAVRDAAPDILVNCAGMVHSGTVLDATDADLDAAMNLNVRPMMHTIKAALPAMLERGQGSIVNVASAVGSILAAPNRFVYATSKAAVIGLTKSVAIDYVTRGIRANAICPGTVDSPSLHDRLRATGDYDAALAAFIARQPMGRIAKPHEIAALAVYLGSDESGFTTGQAHVVDGGWANG